MKIEFFEKIKSALANLDEKNRYYIFGGILLFVFLLDYFLLMRPQLGALAKLNPENKILSEEIQKAKDDIQQLTHYQKEVEKAKQKVEEVNLKVRSREEVSAILETITLLANKNGVKIEQITPDTTDQKVLLDNKERKYYALPIDVQAKAGYHDLGRFLNQVETEGLFLAVNNFTISSSGELRYQNVKLTLKAIVFEESHAKK